MDSIPLIWLISLNLPVHPLSTLLWAFDFYPLAILTFITAHAPEDLGTLHPAANPC